MISTCTPRAFVYLVAEGYGYNDCSMHACRLSVFLCVLLHRQTINLVIRVCVCARVCVIMTMMHFVCLELESKTA